MSRFKPWYPPPTTDRTVRPFAVPGCTTLIFWLVPAAYAYEPWVRYEILGGGMAAQLHPAATRHTAIRAAGDLNRLKRGRARNIHGRERGARLSLPSETPVRVDPSVTVGLAIMVGTPTIMGRSRSTDSVWRMPDGYDGPMGNRTRNFIDRIVHHKRFALSALGFWGVVSLTVGGLAGTDMASVVALIHAVSGSGCWQRGSLSASTRR